MRPEQLSKQRQKYVQSLHLKKNRVESGLFLVEGIKNLAEALRAGWDFDHVYLSTKGWDALQDNLGQTSWSIENVESIQKISTLQVNQDGVGIARQKTWEALPCTGLNLVLDGLKDPGNLGTILRLADWYNVHQIWCTPDCVELYNPKVIAASMGSFTRVRVILSGLEEALTQTNLPVFGAFLDGQSVYEPQFPETGWLIIGSESHGIRPNLASFVTNQLTIPRRGQAESLNASIATGILLDNWFRPLK